MEAQKDQLLTLKHKYIQAQEDSIEILKDICIYKYLIDLMLTEDTTELGSYNITDESLAPYIADNIEDQLTYYQLLLKSLEEQYEIANQKQQLYTQSIVNDKRFRS